MLDSCRQAVLALLLDGNLDLLANVLLLQQRLHELLGRLDI